MWARLVIAEDCRCSIASRQDDTARVPTHLIAPPDPTSVASEMPSGQSDKGDHMDTQRKVSISVLVDHLGRAAAGG